MSLREKMRKENREGEAFGDEDVLATEPVVDDVDKVDLTDEDIAALSAADEAPESNTDESMFLAQDMAAAGESTDETEGLVANDGEETTDEVANGSLNEVDVTDPAAVKVGIDMAAPGEDKTVIAEKNDPTDSGGKPGRPEIVPGSRESAAGYGNIDGPDSK